MSNRSNFFLIFLTSARRAEKFFVVLKHPERRREICWSLDRISAGHRDVALTHASARRRATHQRRRVSRTLARSVHGGSSLPCSLSLTALQSAYLAHLSAHVALRSTTAPLRSDPPPLRSAPLRSTTAPLRSGPASLYDERRLLDDVTRLRLVDDATSASTHTVSLSLSDARRDRARRTLRHGRTALCRSGGSTDSHPTRFRSHGRSMAPAAATVPAVHRPLRAASAAAPLLRRPPRHDASLSSTIDDLSSTLYHPRLYFANVFLYPCSPKIFLKLFFLIIFASAMKVED